MDNTIFLYPVSKKAKILLKVSVPTMICHENLLYNFLLFFRVLCYSGREPVVEPICESSLARQADVPHLQQCPREGRAWAPAQKDIDALCQPHISAHLPLSEHGW